MSRRAAEAGFEEFLEDTLEAIHREFSVSRALAGSGVGPGGVVVERLLNHTPALERRIVEPELARYREALLSQFQVLLDWVESDDPLSAYADELLERDSLVAALDPDVTDAERERVADAVLESLRVLGEGIAPIVERPEDDFWTAAEAAFDRERALALVGEAFPFTGPLRGNEDLFAFRVRIDPSEILGPFALALPDVRVEYTDEAIRAMIEGERQVVEQLQAAVRERFDATG